MSQINTVDILDPALISQLSEYSSYEFSLNPLHKQQVEQMSVAIWELWNESRFLGFSGVATESFFGPQVFWLLTAPLTRPSDLRSFRLFSELLHDNFPRAITYVERGWRTGERFAQFCGFTPSTGRMTAYDKVYIEYVRKY